MNKFLRISNDGGSAGEIEASNDDFIEAVN